MAKKGHHIYRMANLMKARAARIRKRREKQQEGAKMMIEDGVSSPAPLEMRPNKDELQDDCADQYPAPLLSILLKESESDGLDHTYSRNVLCAPGTLNHVTASDSIPAKNTVPHKLFETHMDEKMIQNIHLKAKIRNLERRLKAGTANSEENNVNERDNTRKDHDIINNLREANAALETELEELRYSMSAEFRELQSTLERVLGEPYCMVVSDLHTRLKDVNEEVVSSIKERAELVAALHQESTENHYLKVKIQGMEKSSAGTIMDMRRSHQTVLQEIVELRSENTALRKTNNGLVSAMMNVSYIWQNGRVEPHLVSDPQSTEEIYQRNVMEDRHPSSIEAPLFMTEVDTKLDMDVILFNANEVKEDSIIGFDTTGNGE